MLARQLGEAPGYRPSQMCVYLYSNSKSNILLEPVRFRRVPRCEECCCQLRSAAMSGETSWTCALCNTYNTTPWGVSGKCRLCSLPRAVTPGKSGKVGWATTMYLDTEVGNERLL